MVGIEKNYYRLKKGIASAAQDSNTFDRNSIKYRKLCVLVQLPDRDMMLTLTDTPISTHRKGGISTLECWTFIRSAALLSPNILQGDSQI